MITTSQLYEKVGGPLLRNQNISKKYFYEILAIIELFYYCKNRKNVRNTLPSLHQQNN